MTTTETEAAIILATGQIVAARLPGYGGLLVNLIRDVRKALTGPIEEPAPEPAPAPTPAVPIRRSVTPDLIYCLEDGKGFKSLKRHLSSHYGMTPDQYRAKWGLPADYPMVAPNYSARRSQLAKDNGLGKKGSH